MAYSEALWAYRSGNGMRDVLLREALEENWYVPFYLLGEKHIPFKSPDHYSPGNEEEAVIYAKEALAAWRNAAGALAWLKEIRNACLS